MGRATRVNEFVILAQLAIGGAVGARLAKVPFRELLGYLRDACATTALILAAYLLATVMVAKATGVSFLTAWLAFVPGGLYEVTLLALIFGFDVAFVAFHHTIRVMLIFLSLPAMALRLGAKDHNISEGPSLGIDHMDWRPVAPRHHLIEDIGELDLQLILGDEADMRRCNKPRVRCQRVVGPGDGFLVKNVDRRPPGPAGIQRRLQGAGCNQASARGVDQNRSRPHQGQIVGRDQPHRGWLQPDMKRHDITCRKEGLAASATA